MRRPVRVAVVGGGIFGVTAAVRLARAGYPVDLIERSRDLLMAASGINQFRLHRGYHYPRSPETSTSCQEAEAGFLEEYGKALVGGITHYYAIAKEGSLVSAEDYLAFCERQRLEYEVAWPDILRRETVELCLKVREELIDLAAWRGLCWAKLRHAGVQVRLSTEADERLLEAYDFVIVSTYATLNALLSRFPAEQIQYQFELCEKPVVRLPKAFHGQSLVIMDGPFMCVDPFGRTGLFVLGNVVEAIHHTTVGMLPVADARYRPLLNAGVVAHPPVTRFNAFIAAASRFIPQIAQAEHIGSMFTFRAVLPGKEETDERPTMVRRISDRVATIFSGKIGTCVAAAEEVLQMVRQQAGAGGRAAAERPVSLGKPR